MHATLSVASLPTVTPINASQPTAEIRPVILSSLCVSKCLRRKFTKTNAVGVLKVLFVGTFRRD